MKKICSFLHVELDEMAAKRFSWVPIRSCGNQRSAVPGLHALSQPQLTASPNWTVAMTQS